MSTYRMIVHGIACDYPDCPEMRDDIGSGMTYAELRKKLAKEGWTYRNGRDLCPGDSGRD